MLIQNNLFKTSQRSPLYLAKDMCDLLNEWRSCSKLEYPADKLCNLLEFNIIYWVKMLLTNAPKTIEYLSLLGRLDHPDPISLLNNWAKANKDELPSILFEVYLNIARKGSVVTTNNDTLPFLISRYFVLRLANTIRSWSSQVKRQSIFDYTNSLDHYPTSENDPEPTLLLEYELQKQTAYDYYVISLYRLDLDRDELFKLTHSHHTRNYIRRWLNEYGREKKAS